MLFVIDLDSLELIQAATDKSPVVSVQGKRGDETPFEVIFVRNGVAEELATSSVLTFGAKQAGKYDAGVVVLSSDFTLSGTGTSAKYLASPSFNTEELNDLFLIDEDDTNDPAYVDLMAEFTWQVGSGAPTSTKTFTFRVHNDVVRDSELNPTALPTPIGNTAPVNAVTGVYQVETMTIVAAAGCTSNGNLVIGAGGLWVGGSPYPIFVPLTVATHTTAELIAEAIRAAYAANSAFAAAWSISRAGAVLTMTRLVAEANDGTANFTISGGLGVSTVATSTNTTSGVAAVTGTMAPPYLRVAGEFLYIQEAGVWKKVALSAL